MEIAAALARDLQANGVECSHLCFPQLAVLLSVKNGEKRKEVAIEALREGLSMRQLLIRVEEMKSHAAPNGRQKMLFKKIEDPLKLLSDEETTALLSDQDRLAREMETRERLDLVTVIDKIGAQMDESKRFIRQVKSNLVRIELADCEETQD
jgi:hypothetical protein